MNTNNSNMRSKPAGEEISLKDIIISIQEWWYYLLSKWLIILVFCILGAVLGLLYSKSKKPTYIASLTFVLEEEDSGGGLGNIGGLAAIAGYNVGGIGGGIFQGNNILELYKSRSMLTKTLLSNTVNNDSLLVDRYIGFNELRKGWEKNPGLADINFSIPKAEFTLQHDSLLGKFVNTIRDNLLGVTKPDKALSIFQVKTTSLNEDFAKDFTEVLVQNVNEFYIETKTKKALQNLSIIQHQADSVRQELNAAISGVALAKDANPNANPGRQALGVSSSRRQVDVQANQVILNELVRNLEASKISLRRETPLIQVIDGPVLPLEMDRVGKAKNSILGGFIVGFLVCLFLII